MSSVKSPRLPAGPFSFFFEFSCLVFFHIFGLFVSVDLFFLIFSFFARL